MRHIQNFENFLETGVVKKQAKDKEKAKFLLENSDESYEMLQLFIKSAGVFDKTANHIIKNAYDAIMERIRSKMAEEGYNSSGIGAHEAEVAYLRKLGFSETEIELADSLRYYRNRILYYGAKLDQSFAEKVLLFLEKIKSLL
ncbi:hypothetical protein HZA96_06125 [Candidatus Woesearchaeota archaeon]|nr:hypothetical protein [Candidatus Woesearchaeota archaeon]